MDEKKIKPVVSNPVKTKKKSKIKKFTENFLSADADNVGSYIFEEVLVPSTKNLISDAIKNAIDILLFGGSERKSRGSSRISYRDYYEDESHSKYRERDSYRSSNLDYDEIIVPSLGEAEVILANLKAIIKRYQFVSVADLYDLAGIHNENYNLHKYGWTNIGNAHVKRIREGYLLVMPKALPID